MSIEDVDYIRIVAEVEESIFKIPPFAELALLFVIVQVVNVTLVVVPAIWATPPDEEAYGVEIVEDVKSIVDPNVLKR